MAKKQDKNASVGKNHLTIKEAAELLEISQAQVRRLLRNHDVIIMQMGPDTYIMRDSLMDFLIRQNMKYMIELGYKWD